MCLHHPVLPSAAHLNTTAEEACNGCSLTVAAGRICFTSLGSTTASVQRQTASKGSAQGVQVAQIALAAAVTPASSLLQDTAPRHSVLLGPWQTGAVSKPE